MNSPNLKLWRSISISFNGILHKNTRFYSSKSKSKSKDKKWKKLRPKILERIKNREKDYPLEPIIPVAQQVLKAHSILHHGVSTLLLHIPIWTCKWCSELYVGENGHLINTCGGYKHGAKIQPHKWIKGTLKDILIPVETFRLRSMSQIVYHDERFDYDRVSAIVELCRQAGAEVSDTAMNLDMDTVEAASFRELNLHVTATETLKAWEVARSGLQRLLCVYPAKVCKYCSEVHVGVSGNWTRLCGVFMSEKRRGRHYWENAKVDDLIPPKIVWCRRPPDPPLLGNEDWHLPGHAPAVVDLCSHLPGHAPAVVDLCSKAGAIVPHKYHYMMEMD